MPVRNAAVRRLLATLGVVLPLLAGAAIWNRNFRTPVMHRLPLPGSLIALDSPAGQRLLADSTFVADYPRLTTNYVSQSRRAYCGVAASVVALNALRSSGPRLDQRTFFDAATSRIKGPLEVTFTGITLEQLADLLRAHDARVAVVHASDSNVDAFRTLARQNLATGGDFVLVNYQRATLGQAKAGHISPLAAYNAPADRFLILDVAANKYPPVWVSTAALWQAMRVPVSSDSPRTRGFLIVREGPRHGAAP